jgi:hypothetical protein
MSFGLDFWRGQLTYVKDQLGHARIKMTVDVYGHLVPGRESAGSESIAFPGVWRQNPVCCSGKS